MSKPMQYPEVDSVLKAVIKKLPKFPQVQYSSKDQLLFLIDIAQRFGLYDAADIIKTFVKSR